MDKQSIDDLAQIISTMNDNSLFDSIQNIEKLYIKLMIEYHNEMQRAQMLGLLSKGKKILNQPMDKENNN